MVARPFAAANAVSSAYAFSRVIRIGRIVTLPRFHVHQNFDSFLMDGGNNGKERSGSESAVHRGVQDGGRKAGAVDGRECGREAARNSAIDGDQLGPTQSGSWVGFAGERNGCGK